MVVFQAAFAGVEWWHPTQQAWYKCHHWCGTTAVVKLCVTVEESAAETAWVCYTLDFE